MLRDTAHWACGACDRVGEMEEAYFDPSAPTGGAGTRSNPFGGEDQAQVNAAL